MSVSLTNTATRSVGIGSDLFTLLAWVAFVICLAQIAYIGFYRVDLLQGVAGIHIKGTDSLGMFMFYLIGGFLAFALATGWLIKFALGTVLVYLLWVSYGVLYEINGADKFSINALPKVDASTLQAYSADQRVLKCTTSDCKQYTAPAKQEPVTISSTSPEKWEAWGNENGYTKDFELTGSKSDPNSTLGWCYADNPKTGKINFYNTDHSVLNCITGWRWKPPVKGS